MEKKPEMNKALKLAQHIMSKLKTSDEEAEYKEPVKHTPQEFIGTKLMYENATIFSIRENGHCQPIVDLRGFGAIQNLFKDNSGKVNYDVACEFQDSVGEHIKASIESYERLQSENERMRELLKEIELEMKFTQGYNPLMEQIQTLLNPK